jgi:hypothetical protein
VVEGTGLENRQAGDRLVGSNPTPSAIDFTYLSVLSIFMSDRVITLPHSFPHSVVLTLKFRAETPHF